MKDPGEQEKFVEYLHFCETVTALSVLKPGKFYYFIYVCLNIKLLFLGGAFVLKIFTMFEDSTINLLYLLNCVFDKVTIIKPCTSKSGNSEVYVVNLYYKGFDCLANIWDKIISVYIQGKDRFISKSMFNLTDIHQDFYEEIRICSQFFMKYQMKTILDNIDQFETQVPDKVQSKKWAVTKLFFEHHPVNIIPEEKKLVPNINIVKKWRTHLENVNSDIHSYCNKAFFKNDNFDSILNIRVGKKIETVYNSIFIPKEYLGMSQNYLPINKNSFSLYKHILSYLCTDNNVIDCEICDFECYHKYQYNLFSKIVKSVGPKNIIFFNIPLITHFLVGLLYILLFGYKKICFWNNFIILYEIDVITLPKVKHVLSEINSEYKKINVQNLEHCGFEKDIIQLISPIKLDEGFNNLINLIWNYNSHIFSQKKMPLLRDNTGNIT